MSARLGVPSLASFSSLAFVLILPVRRLLSFHFGSTRSTSSTTRTPPAASMPSQKGLSWGFFMAASLFSRRNGGGLAGLLGHGHFEGDVVAPVRLLLAFVQLLAGIRLRHRPLEVGRLLLDAPEVRRGAFEELPLAVLDHAGLAGIGRLP